MRSDKSLIIGIGNPDRGDDAVGLVVARLIRARRPGNARVIEHSGEPTDLLAWLHDAESAYLVDACRAGAPPGTISRFDVAGGRLPRRAPGCSPHSTHGIGLAETVELARMLGRLPRRCVLYAIEGQCYDIGVGLSPSVARAAQKAAQFVWDDLCEQAECRS